MRLDGPSIRMYIIQPNPIIKARNNQLLPDNIPHIDPNPIPPNFLLIPKQNKLILIPSNQDTTDNQAHADALLVIGCMRDDDV